MTVYSRRWINPFNELRILMNPWRKLVIVIGNCHGISGICSWAKSNKTGPKKVSIRERKNPPVNCTTVMLWNPGKGIDLCGHPEIRVILLFNRSSTYSWFYKNERANYLYLSNLPVNSSLSLPGDLDLCQQRERRRGLDEDDGGGNYYKLAAVLTCNLNILLLANHQQLPH